MTLTESQAFALKEEYARMIVDGMDMDTLCTFAIESIMENLKDYTSKELQDEIVELYDEEVLDNLMEEVNSHA